MEMIECTQMKCFQLTTLGFIKHEGITYYLKSKYRKEVDVNDINLEPGEIIASNGAFNLVLTTDQKQAQRSTLTAKNHG